STRISPECKLGTPDSSMVFTLAFEKKRMLHCTGIGTFCRAYTVPCIAGIVRLNSGYPVTWNLTLAICNAVSVTAAAQPTFGRIKSFQCRHKVLRFSP